jgi:hypothetical protein
VTGLTGLVAALHHGFDADRALADVRELCRFDRYQASAGIAAAADYVAERLAGVGVTGVEVLRFPADGRRRWWTFDSPGGWTPDRAAIVVDGSEIISYPEQPYALAANSAALQRDCAIALWSTVDEAAGALLVVDEPGIPVGRATARARELGAAAVVIDTGNADGVGRIELPAGNTLAAFSATAQQIRRLAQAHRAHVEVHIGRTDTMPVVTGVIAGDAPGELLLTAHLCHPRPSANDNASGVAALLGLAPVLEPGRGPGIRLLCGPEFTGTAAFLHEHPGHRPRLGVNVDMAGEDQARCGSALVVERSPDERPHPASAVAERAAALLPTGPWSYSGAVPCGTWAHRVTPHLGASDHALLTGCPSIGLGHWPDRFNHTSADTVDKVDPAEIRRTATIAGAVLAAERRRRTDPELARDLDQTTLAWAVRHLTAQAPPRPAGGPAVLDPWSPRQQRRRLAHRAAVAAGTLTGPARPLRAVQDALYATTAPDERTRPLPDTVLTPTLPGPVNLRALAAAAPGHRDWLDAQTAADRGGSWARMHGLVRALDGTRGLADAAWWAAFATELPIPVEFVHAFAEVLLAAGWASTDREEIP